jgi:hypothetical protein
LKRGADNDGVVGVEHGDAAAVADEPVAQLARAGADIDDQVGGD